MTENSEAQARAKVLQTFIDEAGRIPRWPSKVGKQLILLQALAGDFEPAKQYTEQEVNAILMQRVTDYVRVRRDMVDRGLLARTTDGRQYWVKEA